MMDKPKKGAALEFCDPKTEKWTPTRGFKTTEKAIEAMEWSAQQFSGPEMSRLRVRDMDADQIVCDRIVLRRVALETEPHVKFDIGDPNRFLNIAFEWHTVH